MMNCDAQHSVVVADDEPEMCAIATRLVATAGFEVVGVACDGDETLRVIRQYHPAVAILDMLMPGASVFDLNEQVRAEQFRTKIVMMTGYHREDFVHRALESGAMGVR